MKKYIAANAAPELIEYIKAKSYEVVPVRPAPGVPAPLAMHADLQMCRLGVRDDAPVFFAAAGDLTPDYPGDVPFNAACTGKYFIHNLKYTSPLLLAMARAEGMQPIDVRQGYAKCSIVVVDENSIITYDDGIAKACRAWSGKSAEGATKKNDGIAKACRAWDEDNARSTLGERAGDRDDKLPKKCSGPDVLKIRPGFVRLDGYDTGFIGGASGRLGDEIVFNGDITKHPDWEAIREFIEERNLRCKWFDWELTDIGSII